jgi:hypothetical protein
MDPNFVYPAILKNQTAPSYDVPDGSIGLFASGNKLYIKNSSQEISGLIDASQTGNFGGNGNTGYLTGYVSKTETGQFYPTSNPSGYVTGDVVRPSQTGNIAVGTIGLILDGGGSTITTGYKSFTTTAFSGEILSYTVLADRTGSIVIDIWKDSYANYPLTSGDSICATNKVTLATGIKNTDSTLTSWTKTFAVGDNFGFNVDSVSGVQKISLTLRVKKA